MKIHQLLEMPIEPTGDPNDPTVYGHERANPMSLKGRIQQARNQLQELAKAAESDDLVVWESICKKAKGGMFMGLEQNLEQIRHGIEELAQRRRKGGSNARGIDKGIGEAKGPAQQAAIAIAMKKAGKKPKGVAENVAGDVNSKKRYHFLYPHVPLDMHTDHEYNKLSDRDLQAVKSHQRELADKLGKPGAEKQSDIASHIQINRARSEYDQEQAHRRKVLDAEKIKRQARDAKRQQGVAEEKCPHCNGPMVSEELMNEKKDACYYKVKSRYKVWPSAYASGALVKCRKKGADSWGNGSKNEGSILEGIEQADESLHDWFNKEKWVRMDTKGNIKGPCAKEPGEGKPKCLPQAKAHSLGKKGRASAAARKRREDPNPDRSGKAINVNTKKD